MGFGVWGLGFGVWGLGFGVWGLGFGVWGLGFGVWGLGFGVWGLGFGVWGLGFRVRGFLATRLADLSGTPPQGTVVVSWLTLNPKPETLLSSGLWKLPANPKP